MFNVTELMQTACSISDLAAQQNRRNKDAVTHIEECDGNICFHIAIRMYVGGRLDGTVKFFTRNVTFKKTLEAPFILHLVDGYVQMDSAESLGEQLIIMANEFNRIIG